jgi:PEP-CTERM motif-containing protein
MRTKRSHARSCARVPKSRWAAYATAAAASATASIQSADADITYSGLINRLVADTNPGGSGGVDFASFALNGNAYFDLFHGRNSNAGSSQSLNLAGFFMAGDVSAMFRGTSGPSNLYAAKLASGVNVSVGKFVSSTKSASSAVLAYHNLGGNSFGNFTSPGIGFIGIKFDSGKGTQYGWIRVQMNGPGKGNTFTLVDYAYADVGEAIETGQVPEPNSLAFLAFGGVGLLAWRKWRARLSERDSSTSVPSSTF